ncbi:hypothetical protein C1I98_22240 [Spongiactinospora gelatinilytica]|uniref:Uncharacterized protein n=1 Tax=Spongiactinospora gelatinilytica TaxID=2666298 RepID=A0A2W2FYZ3_9ACTN|nr:hypothetical protein [Spongiactinospora gelatinilytica]PZG40961.1 hypothetical protein C1I98_22240 [Spongiactinospora gelatinilytica]
MKPTIVKPEVDLAYADQSYALRGTHEAVPALYRSAAIREGREVVRAPEPYDGMNLVCLTKVVNGQKAFLAVHTSKVGGGDYHLAIRSAADGGDLCE